MKKSNLRPFLFRQSLVAGIGLVLCSIIALPTFAVDPLVDPAAVFSIDPVKNLEMKIEKMFTEFEARFAKSGSREEKLELSKQFKTELSDRIAEIEVLATLAKRAEVDLPSLEASGAGTYTPRSGNEQNLMRMADFYRQAEAAGYDAGTPPMDPNMMEILARGGGRTRYSASEFAALHLDMQRDAVVKSVRTLAGYNPRTTLQMIHDRLEGLNRNSTSYLNFASIYEQIRAAHSGVTALKELPISHDDKNPPAGPSSGASLSLPETTAEGSGRTPSNPAEERVIASSGVGQSQKSNPGFPWPGPILRMAEGIDNYFQRRAHRAETRRLQRIEKTRAKTEEKQRLQNSRQVERERKAEEQARLRRDREEQKRHEQWVRENNIYWSSSYKPESEGSWFVSLLEKGFVLGVGAGSTYWWWLAMRAMVSENYFVTQDLVMSGILVVPLTIATCADLIGHLADKSRERKRSDRDRYNW